MGIEIYGCSMGTFMIEAPVAECHTDVTFSVDAEPDYGFELKTPAVREFIGDGYLINEDLMQTISGQACNYRIEYHADVEVQARRHRKKRINKKWLKRYGYKTVRRKFKFQCEQITMTPDDDDLGVRFDVEGVKL